jgi:hypothetical protein
VQHGLTILPDRNLVTNVGFDDRATHTTNEDSDAANMPVEPMAVPLDHPAAVVRDYAADRYTSKHHYKVEKDSPGLWYRATSLIPERVKGPLRSLMSLVPDR